MAMRYRTLSRRILVCSTSSTRAVGVGLVPSFTMTTTFSAPSKNCSRCSDWIGASIPCWMASASYSNPE